MSVIVIWQERMMCKTPFASVDIWGRRRRLRVRVRTGRTDPTHSTVCGHLLHRVWSMGPFRSESVSASKNGLSGRR